MTLTGSGVWSHPAFLTTEEFHLCCHGKVEVTFTEHLEWQSSHVFMAW